MTMDWDTIERAPTDGTPLLLFARSKNASAPVVIVGWYVDELGWIEGCFAPNSPVGIEPTHWMPRPDFPRNSIPASEWMLQPSVGH
jgi:hypothetical protein